MIFPILQAWRAPCLSLKPWRCQACRAAGQWRTCGSLAPAAITSDWNGTPACWSTAATETSPAGAARINAASRAAAKAISLLTTCPTNSCAYGRKRPRTTYASAKTYLMWPSPPPSLQTRAFCTEQKWCWMGVDGVWFEQFATSLSWPVVLKLFLLLPALWNGIETQLSLGWATCELVSI